VSAAPAIVLTVEPLPQAGCYRVSGGAAPHVVVPATPACDCAAFRYHPGTPCKHLVAVEDYLADARASAVPVALVRDEEPSAAGPGLDEDPPPLEPPDDAATAAPGSHAGDGRFTIYHERALGELPDPSWLIRDILPYGGFAMLYGPPGSAKSFLALSWALAVGTDRAWFDHAVLWAPVLYCWSEGGRGLKRRVAAWRDALGETIGGADSAHFMLEAPNLLSRRELDDFIGTVQDAGIHPNLVVLDTLARSMPGGDENSPKDMGLAIAGIDRIRRDLSSAVLAVHHTVKNGEQERGHSMLRGAVDVSFRIDNEEGALTLEHVKTKDGELLPARRLRLVKQGASCIVDLADGQPQVKRLTRSALKALRALMECFTGGETTTQPWIDVAGLTKATFYRSRTLLESLHLVTQDGPRWRVSVQGAELLSRSQSSLTEVS